MAEFVGLLAGGGAGGIGSGIGRAIGDALRSVGRVLSGVVRTLGKGFDKVAGAMRHFVTRIITVGAKVIHFITRFFRYLAHYVLVLFRYAARLMNQFYKQFQQDPLTTLQFVGTMAILVNSGL